MTRKDIHNSETPAICKACEARHRGICGALTGDELVALSRHTRQVHHGAGEELMAEAEETTSFANVMNGVVKLTKMLSDGRQQVVGLQFAPDFLGRPFAKESNVTAEAASGVDLCRIPRNALETMLTENADLERRVFQQTLRELDEARDWMLTLGRKTAAEKVASFLLMIATHIDPYGTANNTGITFDLPLTRADIADFLGLTVETVSRQITKLRSDKVIEITNNRHIAIPSLERLEDRCG
jgi:CRP/FNR family transcriptional regulator